MTALSLSPFAVLLLAHGGPESLDDIPAFLSHIRHGRPVSDNFVEEVRERYRLIGGASPLKKLSESLAQQLTDATGLPVYVGMRHWYPFIADTLAQIKSDGHHKVLVICLAPHYSEISIGQYKKACLKAPAASGLRFHFVERWHLQQGLLDFWARELKPLLKEDATVLLTAHSLPARIVAEGDHYVEELEESVAALQRVLGPSPALRLVFQSASPSGEPWLGPQLEEVLEQCAASSRKRVIICPIGFVSEHVEVAYDLDVAAKEQANRLGLQLTRTKMLNDSHEMLAILANIVEESAAKDFTNERAKERAS